MDKFSRDMTAVTWMGPAILGAVFGFLAYQTVTTEESLFLAMLFVIAGIGIVSIAARVLRQLMTPHQKNDADL